MNSEKSVEERLSILESLPRIEIVTAWGQRKEPAQLTTIYHVDGRWIEVAPDAVKGLLWEKVGVYLGGSLVVVTRRNEAEKVEDSLSSDDFSEGR